MSSSDINSVLIEAVAADPDGFAETQTPGGAGNLTLNGDIASSVDVARNVSVTCGSDINARTFTFTGTDENGDAQTEVVTGVNANTVAGTKFFATVTQIAVDAGTGAAITAGTGSSVSSLVFGGRMRLRGMYVVNSGSSGLVKFRAGSGVGSIRMQYRTSGTNATTEFPNIPDDGILIAGKTFVTFDQTTLTSMTVFHS
tara:strand:+ start:491 stop:1087 length:597 start_codon:yes stop_codon:yes gene_type:complete